MKEKMDEFTMTIKFGDIERAVCVPSFDSEKSFRQAEEILLKEVPILLKKIKEEYYKKL